MKLKWFVAVALICGIPAFAGPILLNNTGMNGATPITPGNIDPNWILAGGNYNPSVTTGSASSFPFPIWLANDSTSQWISPQATYVPGVTSDGDGWNWVFRTSFDLTGMVPSTASISGRWLADNEGLDIYINDQIYLPNQTTPLNTFQTWSLFALSGSSGLFQDGANTMSFIVHNVDSSNGGPAGLRVEFQSASAEDIPEPTTFGLLGAGLLALGLLHRRKRA